jgi:hypothetical protein
MHPSIQSLAREVRRSSSWRKCFAWIAAAASFLLGRADEFPEPFSIPLLALPVPALLLTMVSESHFGLIGR